MTDRLSAFADPRMIELINSKFIALTGDDWYVRRQDDAVGKFFRSVADQGPRKGGGTKQGIYVFTASGKLLGFNNNRGADRKLAMLQEALRKWDALPEGETKAGAVKVGDVGKRDARYYRELPEGGLALRTFTRVLEPGKGGELKACSTPPEGMIRGLDSAFDHVWIREEEWKDLVGKAREAKGEAVPFSDRLAKRIARFHLTDNTRGEPPMWKRDDIKELRLDLAFLGEDKFSISGEFSLETGDSERGYQGTFTGTLEQAEAGVRPSKFELLAIGDHWGEGQYTRGARPGKNPMGVVFEIADGSFAPDSVPPQAIRWEQGYYEAEKH